MKRLSIIIVTYNSEGDIYDCLDSIFRWNDLPQEELEVIVVDNNSAQGEAMFSRLNTKFGNRLTLISNTRNGGYGQGNNIGIKRATAPVVMVMNPDVRLMEPVLATACKAFDNPQLCIYGMQQMLSPTERSMGSFIPTDRINGYAATLMNGLCARLNIYLPRWMYMSGSCFFVRRDMFLNVGLFDEGIFLYGEEGDIHHRLGQRYGYHMVYNPRLHYIHLTKEREMTPAFLKTSLEACLLRNEKNGYPRIKTLRNRRQANRVLLWRERLAGRKAEPYCVLLSKYDNYLSGLIKAEKQRQEN